MNTSTSADAGEYLRYVYTTWTCCPKCGRHDLYVKKTHPIENDGSRTQDVRCRHCRWDFIVVTEADEQ